MINVDVSMKVNNVETMLAFLEDEQKRTCHNSFLDLHETEVLNECAYEQLQFKKYAYAVRTIDDSF